MKRYLGGDYKLKIYRRDSYRWGSPEHWKNARWFSAVPVRLRLLPLASPFAYHGRIDHASSRAFFLCSASNPHLKVRVQKGRFSAPKLMLPMCVFSKRFSWMKLGTSGAERTFWVREHLRCFRRKHDFVSIRLGPAEFKIRCRTAS
jgi:hypothetical protein